MKRFGTSSVGTSSLFFFFCFAATEHSVTVFPTSLPPSSVLSPSPIQHAPPPPLAAAPQQTSCRHRCVFRLRGGGSPAAAGMELASPPHAMSAPRSKRRKRTEFLKAEGGDSSMDYTRYQQEYAEFHKEEMVNEFSSSSESEGEDLAGLSYDEWYRRWMERDEAKRLRKNWRHKETDHGQGVFEGRFSKDDIMGWCNYVPLHPNIASNTLSSLPLHQLNRHLLFAAEHGHQELLTRLVEAGADVNQGNNESYLPASVRFGHNDEHHNPMQTSQNCTYGSFDAERKQLVAAVYNWTALHWATNSGHASVVELLLGMGADVDRGDEQGMTPLHLAAASGSPDLVRTLLAAGGNASSVDKSGTPALFYAAGEGHEAVVEELLEGGADVNQENHIGWTALFWAAQANKPGVVRVLLERGADPEREERGEEFKNALRIAEEKDYEEVCELLAAKMGLTKVTPEELNSIERRDLEDQCRARLAELRSQIEKQVAKDPFETVSAEEAQRRGPSMEHQILEEEELLERLQEINRRHLEEAGEPSKGNLW